MARLGTFDPQLEPKAWFDENALAEGWFVADLIPSATGAYTLVADGATYTYSGNNANLVTPRISADGGTYTYSGNAANLLFNRRLVADGGTYSYSGNNANTLFGRTVAADGGTYTYSGNNANTLFGRTVAADGGTYTYSGNAANLIYTPAGAYTLIADGGVYSYSGNNANTLFGRKVAADGGTYSYSGNAADFVYSPTPVVTFDTHDGDRVRKRIRKVRDERELRREQVITAYQTLLEARPEEATELVAEYATPATTLRAPSIDFDALLADIDAAERLYEAYLEMDDEEVMMLI